MSYNYKKPNNVFDIRKDKSQFTNSYELLLGKQVIATILFDENKKQFAHFIQQVRKLGITSKK